MCGIAGIVRWKRPSSDDGEIQRMTAAVSHRGPDGLGFYRRDGVALGHRRLAIIDPELGIQPMSDEKENIWLTYNGELYNFRELKAELQQFGHKFQTNSDTEVVIHAYQQWGVECLKRFRGMFAFAIADFRERRLFLARDHFGIKPLYYRVGDGYVAFGSELSAIRQVDDVVPTGSLEAIDLFLRYSYIPTPHTIYRDTYKLPPANYLVVGFDGKREDPVKYWQLAFQPGKRVSDEEWIEKADDVIRESVRAHLVSDVPFGIFLSGGIDSTLVALEMSRVLERPIKAFAIGFKEDGYSELAFAEQVAAQCDIELHTEVIEDTSLRFLPELIAHYGEPFGDSSAIPTWYVSRLAREHVPMVLSGDGGDEAFAGYINYSYWQSIDLRAKARADMRKAPRASFYWARKAVRQRLRVGSWNDLVDWHDVIDYVRAQTRLALWRPEYHGSLNSDCDVFDRAHEVSQHWDRVAYAQYLDYQTYLPCDILTKVDVASMYHGLEVRTPLIDLRVVDVARQLPLTMRLRQNGSSGPIRKYALKNIVSKYFPDDFVHRRKQGFAIPRDKWFLNGQSARNLLEEIVDDMNSRLTEFFNPKAIHAQIDLHPGRDNSSALWLLLVLGLWLRQNREVSFA